MTDETKPLIFTTGLTKVYEDVKAVESLVLSVDSGRVLGLVGPNGAGKTTAMRCMAGIIPATEGYIEIAGYDLSAQPLAAKSRLAFVPDTPHLFDYLTVEEHLQFAGRIHQIEDIEPRIHDLLQEFDLLDKKNHLPQALSRGMKQKVAICLGFLHDPVALFLDEPLTGLDPRAIRRMKDAIGQRAEQLGAAVIVSSHQLELVDAICDEIFIIDGGKKVVAGTVEQIRADLVGLPEDPTLEDIFFRLTEKKTEDQSLAQENPEE
ncbi:MAG: ABC-2 type transport system ATP-binding protein [Planctomycetota bacterium]|jgi:ABC-2 type transport system ATP-binding protein